MTDIPDALEYIQIEETQFKAAVSESVAQKLGGTMNYILNHIIIPSGAIMPFAGPTPPSGWLLCDGAVYLNSVYPALASALGKSWGSISSNSFKVPDLRGMFLRGVDGGAGVDPDAGSRTVPSGSPNSSDNVGSSQTDGVGNHTHPVNVTTSGAGFSNEISSGAPPLEGSPFATTLGNGGDETRPKNAYVLYIIKT